MAVKPPSQISTDGVPFSAHQCQQHLKDSLFSARVLVPAERADERPQTRGSYNNSWQSPLAHRLVTGYPLSQSTNTWLPLSHRRPLAELQQDQQRRLARLVGLKRSLDDSAQN